MKCRVFDIEDLPRLLYIGDVPVEASTGGALLLHRLLSTYPSSRLRVAELEPWTSTPNQRLSGVTYDAIPFGVDRLVRSRLSPWYSVWLHEKAPYLASRVKNRVSEFQSEAILTVAHWHAYRTAAAVADHNSLPLYLIVHDDMRGVHPIWEPLKSRLTETLGETYKQAERRLCVSPYMAEAFEEEWSVKGDVLYPHRGPDSFTYKAPPQRADFQDSTTTIGYAGSTSVSGAKRFIEIIEALDNPDFQFLIFSPLSPELADERGIRHPRIEYRSLIPSSEVVPTLRREVDILFDHSHQGNERVMRYSFPSKLTDYTATGLPIVLWGPDSWSAIRWARDHGGAKVVTENDPAKLSRVLRKLGSDPEQCRRLGQRALDTGKTFFSYEKAVETFQNTLVPASHHASLKSIT